MDGLIYYLQGVRPCVLLYKWKINSSDVFRIRIIESHEVVDVSPRDLHLWKERGD